MRRRLAAAAAVTSAFVLFAAAPAFAQDEEGPPFLVEDNPTCEDLNEIFDLPPDFQLFTLFPKVDPPVNVDNEFVTATLSDEAEGGGWRVLDVVAKDDVFIAAVIVKGGSDAFVYTEGPFTGMTAPPVGQDNTPAISHYEVCGGEEVTPTPTPTTPTETPTESPTVQPTASESPAEVPTAVPAGADNGGGNGSAGLIGLVLAGGVAVAGAAAAVRRRTRHGA